MNTVNLYWRASGADGSEGHNVRVEDSDLRIALRLNCLVVFELLDQRCRQHLVY